MNKTICIYYKNNRNGMLSAAIVKKWFLKNNTNYIDEYGTHHARGGSIAHNIADNPVIIFLGWSYGDNIPDLSEYDKVIMVDISFPFDEMLILSPKLIWIDQNMSAIKDVEGSANYMGIELEGLRDHKFSTFELTWKYFFPKQPIPKTLDLIQLYDEFKEKNIKV